MADETIKQLDKALVVCPLSELLGYGQNYRVTERPNKGHLESRPVKGTDAFADAFFKVLHAEKGEPVTVMDSTGKEITQKGLGFPDEQALRFSMKSGLRAREKFVARVNAGEIKAPRKNWDKTYVAERTVSWEGKDGQVTSYQIGGGIPIDELKDKYPDLYGTKTRRTTEDEGVLDMMDDEVLEALDEADEEKPRRRMGESVSTSEDDELEAMAEEIDGEGAYAEDDEEKPAEVPDASYAATATASDEDLVAEEDAASDMAEFDDDEDKAPATKTQARAKTQGVDKTTMRFRRPQKTTAVRTLAIRWTDEDGVDHTSYKVKHPVTGQLLWLEEGDWDIDGASFEVRIQG